MARQDVYATSHESLDMDAEQLRALQAPLKQRYRDQPTEALATLTASGTVDGASLTCRVETGRALVEAGLHPATGGSGLQACSGDMLLQALVACAAVTLRTVATALAIPIHGGEVRAEGDLDFRGTLGVSKEVPVGFQRIRLRFRRTPAGSCAPGRRAGAGADRHASEADGALLRRTPDASHAGTDTYGSSAGRGYGLALVILSEAKEP